MEILKTTEAAYAKVNLHLEITERRPDGYHEIDTVMQTVSLCDEVSVEIARDERAEMTLTCSRADIPTDENNIACKVARAFLSAIGREKDSVCIHIEKRIPVAAGLGGGSADGAAVLRALNRLYGYPLTKEALCSLATPLGADIPFCIMGGCRRATGIGEIFSLATSLREDTILVIAMGKMGSNTARAYRKIDEQNGKKSLISSEEMLRSLEMGADAVASALYNRFEEVILPENADASAIRRTLRIAGAKGSLMSGSGASVFGIFDDGEKAKEAVKLLRQKDFFATTAHPIPKL